MSRINWYKDRQRRHMAEAARSEYEQRGHAQGLIAPQSSPSLKQWKYLDGLAGKLGHPNGKSLAAELLHVADYSTIKLSSREASQCIDQSKQRLGKQSGREEGKEGVRGRYG